jgi:alkanesulfonate monooxygenase SsuD/methylene tetrahydromethanopterin reductase-like flavin-dependent oxidoreductase (luciferase family)
MRIDILHALSNIDGAKSWGTLLDETRHRARMADELGFDGFWLGEHHFDSYGTDQCPNPVMLAADLAHQLQRIRLGMAAVTLPLWHPVRLAEDLAMLDHFADGKLDVAFSRGILQAEIVNINAEADRADDAKSRAIFGENLEIVRKAWTEDPFAWKGERHEFPHPTTKWPGRRTDAYHDADGNATGLPVIPKPVDGAPPLYMVTESLAGFLEGARNGLGVLTWYPTGRVLTGLVDAYREAALEAGTLAAGERPKVGILRACLVAPTDEEARRIAEPEVTESFEFIKRVRGMQVWLDEGEDPDDPALNAMKPYDLMMERDHLLIGSPESVAARMTRMASELGIDHWLLSFLDGQSPEEVDRTMKLMSDEVLPAVRASGAVA